MMATREDVEGDKNELFVLILTEGPRIVCKTVSRRYRFTSVDQAVSVESCSNAWRDAFVTSQTSMHREHAHVCWGGVVHRSH